MNLGLKYDFLLGKVVSGVEMEVSVGRLTEY